MIHGFKGVDEKPVKYDQTLLAMDCHQNERDRIIRNSKKKNDKFLIITRLIIYKK